MRKRIIFFDTETAGLPANYKGSWLDTNNWPRIVQLAFIVFDVEQKPREVARHSFIICPVDFEITRESERIHGISHSYAESYGVKLLDALRVFYYYLEGALIVAHNLNFDAPVINCEFMRIGGGYRINKNELFCTMHYTTDICQVPGKYGFKWPTLAELHQFLFQCDFEGAHRADVDCEILAKCYYSLIEKELLEVNHEPNITVPVMHGDMERAAFGVRES